MNTTLPRTLYGLLIVFVMALMPVPRVFAQEATVVTTLGRQILKALGKDAVEFGGEVVAEQTAKRLMAEAAETAGVAGSRVVKAQVERILVSGQKSLIFDLRALSEKSILLLDDVTDDALASAIGALARPGVGRAIESLGSSALQKAALAGEVRLPGIGLKLVQHYGDEGGRLVAKLTEDQANSIIASLRPNAINALSGVERSRLLNALASRPDARVFNLEGATGPLVVVASGVVVWHGIDVTLAPDERVTERPDGTVVREKTSVGSRAVEALPAAVRELSTPLIWIGTTMALGITLIAGFLLWRRQSQREKDTAS